MCKEPDPRVRITLAELARLQACAVRHLTFSLTLACPQRCSHCIVNAGPDKGYTTMPLETARQYAAQMPDLYTYGIALVSFTGGEPLLARRQLEVISSAAAEVGMHCGVVTGGHWATSKPIAQAVVKSLPGLHIWDLSTDSYHEKFVSAETIRLAYLVIKDSGRKGTIRLTYHDPFSDADKRLLEYISSFADDGDIGSQKIRKVGRARRLRLSDSHKFYSWNKPCITQGIGIRYDGSIAPCCVNLVEERRHPFQFGDARMRPLLKIHEDYMTHPLLQMMRTVGFTDMMDWLDESGLYQQLKEPILYDVCDLCFWLFTKPHLSTYLANRAGKPENRLRIGVLAARLLGEYQMLRRAILELRSQSHEIEGFEVAAALEAELSKDRALSCSSHVEVS